MASVQNYTLRQRRFAPLSPERKGTSSAPPLKGIVFDVDGTLCLPQNHMFVKMRDSLGILNSDIDILHHISSLPTPEQQLEAADKIKAVEREAMQTQEPQPGLVELMDYLHERGVKRALCTRNFDRGENLIMVGDSIDDMTAGHTAGAATVLLLNDHNVHLKEHPHTDLCIERLDELIGILDGGFVGNRVGNKVPTSD
ncbi:HAD-like domain-containing protein [Aspergillus pseudotamarii]|uniref:HAD-like domain-containing protein n=1 Tax=Aspergillus pseudotamarii TaxID=132259 RepID=A0A5N6SU64_ASPPS|nr:HAD-like domain-containing protein [Aspergillus pseudotamarii]KAE8136684.1 HAD-like domain-containing protein [Aspergillus pseudotamarii]